MPNVRKQPVRLDIKRFSLSLPGAEFTRHADVTFYPGNQRLSIVQTGRGLDSQNYLIVDTHLEGSVPFIPPKATVQMEPFKETYQYYPSCKSPRGPLIDSLWEAL